MIYIYTINKQRLKTMYNSFGAPGDAGGSPFVPIPRFFQQCAALSTTMTDESLETSIIVLLGDKKM